MVDWLNVKNIPVVTIKPGKQKIKTPKKYGASESFNEANGDIVHKSYASESFNEANGNIIDKGFRSNPCSKVTVNKSHQILFVIIPKNASSSVREILGQKETLLTKEEFNKSPFLKIAIFREPLSRFVSGIGEFYRKAVMDTESMSREDFKTIIFQIQNSPWEEVNEHLRLQSWFIKDLKIDRILRFEHLEEDWNSLGLPKLPWLNQGGELYDRIEENIRADEELKKAIMDLYKEDYDLIKLAGQ